MKGSASAKHSDFLFDFLSKSSNEVFFLVDSEGKRFLYISPNFQQIWEQDPKGFYANTDLFFNCIAQPDSDLLRQKIQEVINGERSSAEGKYRIITPSGKTKWMFGKTYLATGADGTSYLVAVASEASRQQSYELLVKEAQQIAKIGSWEYDVARDKMFWTEQFQFLLEESLTTVPSLEATLSFYRESRRELEYKLQQCRLKGKGFQHEGKLHTASGQNIDTKLICNPILDKAGKVIRIKGIIQDITELKKAQETILQNEANLKALIESCNALIWSVDRNYCTMSFNSGFSESIKSFLGHDLEIGEYLLQDCFPETELQNWKNYYDRAFEGEYISFELRYTLDKLYNISYSIGPIKLGNEIIGASIFGLDISARKQAEQLVQETDANLKAVLENTDEPIWSISDKYEITTFNTAFKKQIQKESGIDIQVGDNLVLLFPEKFHKTWFDLYDRALNGERYILQHETYSVAGDPSHFETAFNPIYDEKKKVIGVACFGKNITHIKQAERELREAKERAEEAAKAKTQFLSTISHEIRTPLNAVIGFAHLMMQQNPRAEQVENLEHLRFSAENLLSLVNDVLDFSKIEAGKVTFEEVPIQLQELLTGIRQSFVAQLKEKNLLLQTDIEQRLPKMVIGDPVRLTQVLNNLISNAVKFTSEGNISIAVRMKEETEQKISLRFEITDSGKGIPEDQLESIFLAFEQGDKDTTRKFGGTGLGLAISQRLLELQNSGIQVKSKVDYGSTFSFELDFKKLPKTKETKTKAPISATEPSSLKGVKGLIVDDNELNRVIAKKFLEKWQIEAIMANNGQEAVDALEKKPFDFVLMDLHMPVMDGWQATKAIRASKNSPNTKIPIIALTASVLHELDADELKRCGLDAFVYKPFNPADLYSTICRYLPAGQLKLPPQ